MGIDVMALPISWVSSCCSRSCSLDRGRERCVSELSEIDRGN
jgi:hypothetical protein